MKGNSVILKLPQGPFLSCMSGLPSRTQTASTGHFLSQPDILHTRHL